MRALFNQKPDPATKKQQEFLQILFDDLGYTRTQRNAWLKAETGREVHYLDQLTKAEATKFISEFKETKESRNWDERRR